MLMWTLLDLLDNLRVCICCVTHHFTARTTDTRMAYGMHACYKRSGCKQVAEVEVCLESQWLAADVSQKCSYKWLSCAGSAR